MEINRFFTHLWESSINNLIFRRFFLIVLLTLVTANSSPNFVKAQSDRNPDAMSLIVGERTDVTPYSIKSDECHPNSGFKWVYGPPQPIIASTVEQALSEKEIVTKVEARSYGEIDSCGSFSLFSIDLSVSVVSPSFERETDKTALADQIYQILKDLVQPRLGKADIIMPNGEKISLNNKILTDQMAELTSTASWQQISTSHSPSARYLYGLAYDSDRQVSVLFGGDSTGYSRLNDTWEYDGTDWHQISTTVTPPGRVNIDHSNSYCSISKKNSRPCE